MVIYTKFRLAIFALLMINLLHGTAQAKNETRRLIALDLNSLDYVNSILKIGKSFHGHLYKISIGNIRTIND